MTNARHSQTVVHVLCIHLSLSRWRYSWLWRHSQLRQHYCRDKRDDIKQNVLFWHSLRNDGLQRHSGVQTLRKRIVAARNQLNQRTSSTLWSCSGIPHIKPRIRTHQTANLCQIRHSYVPVTYHSCDCKFFAAKNWNICGPITANKRQIRGRNYSSTKRAISVFQL